MAEIGPQLSLAVLALGQWSNLGHKHVGRARLPLARG